MRVYLDENPLEEQTYPFAHKSEILIQPELLTPGHHTFRVELSNFPGYSPGKSVSSPTRSALSFLVGDERCILPKSNVKLTSPQHGGLYSKNGGLEIILDHQEQEHEQEQEQEQEQQVVCVYLNDTLTKCIDPNSSWSRIRNLPIGRTSLAVHWDDSGDCPFDYIEFDVFEGGGEGEGESEGQGQGESEDLTFVTGASQEYFDDGRLQNLIGSIHYWEVPTAKIVFYDLGLNPAALKQVGSWSNVVVRKVPNEIDIGGERFATPNHVREPGKYAFKSVAIWDSWVRLEEGGGLLWIDAGTEIRKPLNEFRRRLKRNGHFLIEHPYGFPNRQFHHEECVSGLGCVGVEEESYQHCATTFVGVHKSEKKNRFVEVLKEMALCSLNEQCINPPGATRATHRQEQTVMNSIFCREDLRFMCSNEKKYIMSSAFENDFGEGPFVTSDERDYNEIELYTRRVHPVKPYEKHLLVSDRIRMGIWMELD